jgi:hypothetical protein
MRIIIGISSGIIIIIIIIITCNLSTGRYICSSRNSSGSLGGGCCDAPLESKPGNFSWRGRAPRRRTEEERKEEEDAIEELRKKAQELRRKGNEAWRTIHSQMKELMGRGREAKNNPHVEALKREAEELRGKAKEAKTRGDPQWMVAHAQLKKVHRRMDEWERKKREQAYRMIRPEEKERKIEDTHVWRETRAVVRGRTAGNAAKSLDSSREEAPPGKDIRVQLGCNAFVGGVAQGVTSGVLQQHLQQFARVKYCALLTGTRNDRVRAAKVTFVTQAERIKAMATDDSILEGRALRVRAWKCRKRAQSDRSEHKRGCSRVDIILAPPGLEDCASSMEDEGEP